MHGWPTALALATLGALLVLLGLFWAVQPVRAEIRTVTNPGNGGADTLRDIIDNVAVDGDVIEFASNLATTTIILTEPITITKDIEIRGANAITVSGGTTSRIFYVETGAEVTFSGLRLQDGYAERDGGEHKGGAIYNTGVVTLTESFLTTNTVTGTGTTQGTVIHNSANSTLWIIESFFTLNNTTTSADGNIEGGTIFNAGTLFVTNSTIADGTHKNGGGGARTLGGAIHNSGGTVEIEGSTIRNISSEGSGNQIDQGGGLFNRSGTMTVTNSIISQNTAEQGGGLYNTGGQLSVLQSAVLTNTVDGGTDGFGGGIYNDGGSTLLEVQNTTFSGNAANQAGGAIANNNSAIARIENATILNSQNGGGIYNGSNNEFAQAQNTIFASNTGDDCASTGNGIRSQGNNIDSDNSCNLTNLADLPNTDPLLGPLTQEAGEVTPSFKPQANSPAINAGNNSTCTEIDQRGITRPQSVDCDIGSVELPLDLAISKTGTPDTLQAGEMITYTIRFTNTSSVVTATNVLIDDELPAPIIDPVVTMGNSPPTVTKRANTNIQWEIAEFSPGSSGTITVTGIVGSVSTSEITNTVTIRDDSTRPTGTEEANTANNSATVVTNVFSPPPTPPTASDDEAFTQVNTPITIDVLANDEDEGDDPLEIIATGDTTAGSTVLISSSTELVYTPTLDFIGTDVFTYTITDLLREGTDTATVTVTVAPEGVEPGEAVLEVSMVASADLVQPGDALAYTIDVTNNGPEPATSLTATLTLTSGLTFDSASGTDWTCTYDDTTSEVTCLRDNLAANDTGQIVVNTTVAELTSSLAAIVGTLDATVEVRAANSPAGLATPSDSVSVTLEDGLQRLYLPLVSK
jgi:uncharacterized repeat protein (TIGR01451 family)